MLTILSPSPSKSGIKTTHGDIFQVALERNPTAEDFSSTSVPPSSTESSSKRRRIVLLHACNTLGSWGGGIALAFKEQFPEQYEVYREHCLSHANDRIGSSLGRGAEQIQDRGIGRGRGRGRGRGWGRGRGRGDRGRGRGSGQSDRNHGTQDSSLVGTCLLIPPTTTSDISDTNPSVYIGCLFTSRAYGRNRDSPEDILAATRQALMDLMRQTNDQSEEWELHACRFNSGKFGVPWERTAAIIEELGIEMTVYVPPEEA
ncbi:hypothetical protein GYMLUDRAFT_751385 [Collybiopsis luxurians FD-317 M1]|uniref:ADP-ribose 1''-phosphate phosphatase n=1 Tax=Collybiopsis luxurians FD-317 M1 TaxID=944289 RepID=A0A0D0CH37_9AGAR|nr:hypothetical protein GYMLUDRAFT_751385 [Collybiopsis luxurians FD-317 M1]